MRIFSFSGLRIVRLRPRRPLLPGANRLAQGRLRRFHPSAPPQVCGSHRSASFPGPGALRMRPEQCPENISGNMSEDMSGNLPERASQRSPDGSEKRPERPSGKSCNGVPRAPRSPAPGAPPGSPATASLGRLGARHPGPRTRRSPRARRPEPVLFGCGRTFFCYSNNGIRNISVNLSRNKSAKERFQ